MWYCVVQESWAFSLTANGGTDVLTNGFLLGTFYVRKCRKESVSTIQIQKKILTEYPDIKDKAVSLQQTEYRDLNF